MRIVDIDITKIIGSSSDWTIQLSLTLDDGSTGVASVPGGLSKGINEIASIDVSKSIEILDSIKDKLLAEDFDTQSDFDIFLLDLDGTSNKSNLGGNTMLALSLAFCRASAKYRKLRLYEHIHTLLNPDIDLYEVTFKIPRMMMLMLEGGLHGSSDASIQEFMVIVDKIDRGIEIYNQIKKDLHNKGKSTNVGQEGAFSPEGFDNLQSLDLISKYLHGEKIALDVAASSIPQESSLPDYDHIIRTYPIESIEDIERENEWANWEYSASRYLKHIQLVTDDLTTTNPRLLREAINRKVGNAIIIKPNQIGTLHETLRVIKIAHEANWKTIVSHRGTDTNDDFIADLAVGSHSHFTKFGSPARGERVAKYNRLLEIQKEIYSNPE